MRPIRFDFLFCTTNLRKIHLRNVIEDPEAYKMLVRNVKQKWHIEPETVYDVTKTICFSLRRFDRYSPRSHMFFTALKAFSKDLYGDSDYWKAEFEEYAVATCRTEEFDFLFEQTVLDKGSLVDVVEDDEIAEKLRAKRTSGEVITGEDIYEIVKETYFPLRMQKDKSVRSKLLRDALNCFSKDLYDDELFWQNEYNACILSSLIAEGINFDTEQSAFGTNLLVKTLTVPEILEMLKSKSAANETVTDNDIYEKIKETYFERAYLENSSLSYELRDILRELSTKLYGDSDYWKAEYRDYVSKQIANSELGRLLPNSKLNEDLLIKILAFHTVRNALLEKLAARGAVDEYTVYEVAKELYFPLRMKGAQYLYVYYLSHAVRRFANDLYGDRDEWRKEYDEYLKSKSQIN